MKLKPTPLFARSPLDTVVVSEKEEQRLWVKELRDLARGFSGALVIALPLLYTLEMWQRALAISPWVLLLFVALAYLGNVGYHLYSGFKPEVGRRQIWFDGVTALALGALASLITLLLLGRYELSSDPSVIVSMVLLEMVPASFGASLAINQLGSRGGNDEKRPADRLPPDIQKVVATVLGALLFSFNIAPTIEPAIITYTTTWWHTLAILLFSLFVSMMMVSFAGFIERKEAGGFLGTLWLETVFSYGISLLVSLLLLWLFGYVGIDTPLPIMGRWVIVMGYVTTLGGSAGRLVL